MGIFSRLLDLFCSRNHTVDNGHVTEPSVPMDSRVCEPTEEVCPEGCAPPSSVPTKKATRQFMQVEFEQTSSDLRKRREVAQQKLDDIDDFLTKKIQEKNGGRSHGDR